MTSPSRTAGVLLFLALATGACGFGEREPAGPGPAESLAMLTEPSSGFGGDELVVRVWLYKRNGEGIKDRTITFETTGGSPAAVDVRTDGPGQAEFRWKLPQHLGEFVVTATANGSEGSATPVTVQAAVQDAIKAREDKDRLALEAEAYRNDIVPRFLGGAEYRRLLSGQSLREIIEQLGPAMGWGANIYAPSSQSNPRFLKIEEIEFCTFQQRTKFAAGEAHAQYYICKLNNELYSFCAWAQPEDAERHLRQCAPLIKQLVQQLKS